MFSKIIAPDSSIRCASLLECKKTYSLFLDVESFTRNMKKFFKNDTSVQILPRELRGAANPEDDKFAKYIVNWFGENGDYSYQVAHNTVPDNSNNGYSIFVFEKDELLIITYIKSLTQLPPVWDRFGIDYHDYHHIMNSVNKAMALSDKPIFEIDDSYDGKFVHMLGAPLEEVEALISKGESYPIMSVMAEAFFNNCELKSVVKIS